MCIYIMTPYDVLVMFISLTMHLMKLEWTWTNKSCSGGDVFLKNHHFTFDTRTTWRALTCICEFWSRQSCMFLWDEETMGQNQGSSWYSSISYYWLSISNIDLLQSVNNVLILLRNDGWSMRYWKNFVVFLLCICWLMRWIWSNLTVNSFHRLRGSICYASSSALLALWFLEHCCMWFMMSTYNWWCILVASIIAEDTCYCNFFIKSWMIHELHLVKFLILLNTLDEEDVYTMVVGWWWWIQYLPTIVGISHSWWSIYYGNYWCWKFSYYFMDVWR